MKTINIPVGVMDESCAGCKCMSLSKTNYYGDGEVLGTVYECDNIHMCIYIRNRIVRNEEKATKKEDAE